jgi:hypothetical protein
MIVWSGVAPSTTWPSASPIWPGRASQSLPRADEPRTPFVAHDFLKPGILDRDEPAPVLGELVFGIEPPGMLSSVEFEVFIVIMKIPFPGGTLPASEWPPREHGRR